jgi:hypothetical protein
MPANVSLDSVAVAAAKVQSKPDSVVATSNTEAAATAATASPKLANPRLTVDPSVNRVVLEFFSSSGVLTNTIPSQQQLDAYRLAAFSGNPIPAADNPDNA